MYVLYVTLLGFSSLDFDCGRWILIVVLWRNAFFRRWILIVVDSVLVLAVQY